MSDYVRGYAKALPGTARGGPGMPPDFGDHGRRTIEGEAVYRARNADETMARIERKLDTLLAIMGDGEEDHLRSALIALGWTPPSPKEST